MKVLLALWRTIPSRPRCSTAGHHLLLCRLAAPYLANQDNRPRCRNQHHLSLCRLLSPRMGWTCDADGYGFGADSLP